MARVLLVAAVTVTSPSPAVFSFSFLPHDHDTHKPAFIVAPSHALSSSPPRTTVRPSDRHDIHRPILSIILPPDPLSAVPQKAGTIPANSPIKLLRNRLFSVAVVVVGILVRLQQNRLHRPGCARASSKFCLRLDCLISAHALTLRLMTLGASGHLYVMECYMETLGPVALWLV
jgi:hypothetical protein